MQQGSEVDVLASWHYVDTQLSAVEVLFFLLVVRLLDESFIYIYVFHYYPDSKLLC